MFNHSAGIRDPTRFTYSTPMLHPWCLRPSVIQTPHTCSRLSLFMTLSQNAEFNHPKTEIFGSTCVNNTEAFFEAHRNFALTYNANKTSIVLYRTTSLDNLSLRFRFASSCLSVIPQLR